MSPPPPLLPTITKFYSILFYSILLKFLVGTDGIFQQILSISAAKQGDGWIKELCSVNDIFQILFGIPLHRNVFWHNVLNTKGMISKKDINSIR